MNTLYGSHPDWLQAEAQGHSLVAIIEPSLLTTEQADVLAATGLPRWPLLYQPAVAPLYLHGPVLLDLSGQPFERLQALAQRLPEAALHGWLGSPLSAQQLAWHLGDAQACEDSNGKPLLLRSHSARVLPLLYARSDADWHAWLFGPVGVWWCPGPQGWQAHAGAGLSEVPPYRPIRLDEPLLQALGQDSQALALLAHLQQQRPEVFRSDCHGERLAQIETLLADARKHGLQQPADLACYVAGSLLAGTPLSQDLNWWRLRNQLKAGTSLALALADPEGGTR